jgi:hypothetical protein
LKKIEEDRKAAASEDAFNQFGNNGNNNIVARPPVQYQNFVQPQIRQNIPPNINKYSPHYAAYIGVKPRAQASARIRLGGAF